MPPTQTLVEEDVELGGRVVDELDVVDVTEVDVVDDLDEDDVVVEVLEGAAEELEVDVGGGGGAEPPVALKDPT